MRKTKKCPSRKRRRRGVLTLEWILLITIICIGVLGALARVRNALITEFIDLTDAICNTNVGP